MTNTNPKRPSKFGLIQITRQRVRPEMNIVTVEKCPTCAGSGEIQASIVLMDQIENNLRYILKEQNESGVTLCVHPYLEAYITKGFLWNSLRSKWGRKYGKKINVRAVTSYSFLEYHFYNKNEDEINQLCLPLPITLIIWKASKLIVLFTIIFSSAFGSKFKFKFTFKFVFILASFFS